MSRNCIRCKREIAKSQKSCLVCGASQSYISHFRTTTLVFILALFLFGFTGYKFFDAEGKLQEIERLKNVDQENAVSVNRINQLEENLQQKDVEIQALQNTLTETEKSLSQNSLSQNESDLAIKKSQAQANEANKRASWLSKENRRFKQEISDLTAKVQQLERVNTELANANKTPLPLPLKANQTLLPEPEVSDESGITPI